MEGRHALNKCMGYERRNISIDVETLDQGYKRAREGGFRNFTAYIRAIIERGHLTDDCSEENKRIALEELLLEIGQEKKEALKESSFIMTVEQTEHIADLTRLQNIIEAKLTKKTR